jgi:cellulose synthase/poly-beta-1,6-N-acetylglucosamine synthase-like glycosyltransferase
MLNQTYRHDTWLADEDPSDETLAWCERHSVHVSTRRGKAEYHNASWPRRTRCKEGNLAYFYDHYGYQRYDFVAQLDSDHVPTPSYLTEVLRPFADSRIGYVSAPSICDGNAAESWSARARLFIEGPVHGILQAGYTGGLAPLCIGSHYAVRTEALRQIGGLGPELAEDHSTTLMMNASGWRGAHALNAIAHGDGPNTFADMITQEFQWSRSLITIFLQHSPTYVPLLPWRLRFQFVFCQLWYPLVALIFLSMSIIPIVALAFDVPMANVLYLDFLLHSIWMPTAVLILLWWISWQGWLRPANTKIISWEGMLYIPARWPWWLVGTTAAVYDTIRGSTVQFRVTPKGTSTAEPLPLRVVAPYAILAAASGLAVIAFGDARDAAGFYVLALLNCILYAALVGSSNCDARG